MSDDLGALVEFECLNDAPLQYYHEHDTLSSSQSFDTSTTLQHDLSNTMNTDSYDPWSSNNLYGDAKAPMSSVQVHEIDSLGMVSASPSGHSSCVDFGLGNAQWTHPPIYQNTAGGQLVGNPSSQSFGTSPSEEGEHAKFITPPQETSPLPRPNQGPFQHDRQASNSSELAENLDTVHIQTSQAGLGLNANSAYVSGPNANSTTGLLTPEVSPDTIAPKLPFPSTHDLASRRKRPRPAALQPDSNRSASYAGPMTTSPHLRISPPGSGKMSPVRRIKSQGNNSNVIAGRIKKPGATTAQISPRNLESCFKVAEPQSSMDLDAHRRQSSGANGNSLTALSPSTMLNRRQGTWPESPSHTALPSSSWDKSLNNNNMPYATSPPDSHWHPYQSGQSNINMAIHPPQPEYSQQFPHHYPPQSAPSHVTTFEVASMTPENFGVNWLNPPIQSEPYRDDTRLQGPFRPTHLQHHGHSGPFNYYQAPGPSFQTYTPHMGSLLSFPPCLNRPPTPPHKALEIKVETGPPPPKEMVQTSQDRKEYTFENSFAGDPHFLTGSKK